MSDRNREPGSDGESPVPQSPPPYSMPPAWMPPARPTPVMVAAVLWIILGAITSLGGLGLLAEMVNAPYSSTYGGGAGAIPSGSLVVVVGVATIALGHRLRQGYGGVRIGLTCLGMVSLLGGVTVLLVVPAVTLQFLPVSNAWFRAVNPRRPPGPPLPPGRPSA